MLFAFRCRLSVFLLGTMVPVVTAAAPMAAGTAPCSRAGDYKRGTLQ